MNCEDCAIGANCAVHRSEAEDAYQLEPQFDDQALAVAAFPSFSLASMRKYADDHGIVSPSW